ncbi:MULTISPECIES: phosphoribosyl-AMP cyclohydrolase [Methanothermobacter]|uniref:phosphoribosyl-AMP cyclohydrolase n=1 Tax=Methanothermobacter TaxID=145260 RepID=UPI000662976F|nr:MULTISPECIES: phosphoribosyl-AMP cyclohydrolase [Methanothermobacter]QEF93870.1 phosphoribosyl-AMP cyclohydrolase [Methanothermobacter sp. KEPCO-1]QHN08690.1 phosphoribosyl-AMP cyclohydrolase [Methanothermobacter sp. THM-2]WBF10669.1 phosphoribosyl-AMP cyclohydrolase [Methanothermobacter marburgensis]
MNQGDVNILNFRHNINGEDLIIAVAQDHRTGEVLMVAYMNREALERTLETGLAHYWSTSRGKLWLKGESSGHLQRVKDVLVDCDADAVVLKVEQEGGACHTGYRSCFYRSIDGDELRVREDAVRVFDPDEIYGDG